MVSFYEQWKGGDWWSGGKPKNEPDQLDASRTWDPEVEPVNTLEIQDGSGEKGATAFALANGRVMRSDRSVLVECSGGSGWGVGVGHVEDLASNLG